MSIETISPHALSRICEDGNPVDVIDVRTPMEFRELSFTPARNIPLDRLDPQFVVQNRRGTTEDPVYFICRTGNRAAKACEKMIQAGYDNVVNVEGGIMAWEAGGHPVVRGKKMISLERQVRIAAGILVLLGVAFSQLFHPAWLILSGFVGAGLVFAGISDYCGMGLLLAKMPWNQVKTNDAVCCESKEESKLEPTETEERKSCGI